MEFSMIGISYQNADLAIRELSAFSDTRCLSFYDEVLNCGITQAVILSTCNRSEVYVLYEREQQLEQLKQLYIKYCSPVVQPYIFERHKEEGLLYLLEVCAGMHSLVLGEDQIFHQMKNAYELSCAAGACSKEMHKIFQTCFAVIKEMKTKFSMNQKPLSVASLAMQKLKTALDLRDKTMMIVGSGEMAELVRAYAKEEPLKKIYVCNRTKEHITKDANIQVVPFEERYVYAARCDILCSATASPHPIFKKEYMAIRDHALWILDLALPRDVEESVKELNGVNVWNMDDLKGCVQIYRQQRLQMLQQAHPLLERCVQEIKLSLTHESFGQAIMTLQKRSETMAKQTYELLERKLDLTKHERYILQKVLQTSFLRMIKEPIVQLKEVKEEDQEAYLKMLEKLFKGDGKV